MVRYDVQRNPDVIYQPSYFQQSFTGSYLREITSPPRVPEGCVFLDIKCAGPNDVRSHSIDDGCGVAGVLLCQFHAADPNEQVHTCLLYTSPSPRDGLLSRM